MVRLDVGAKRKLNSSALLVLARVAVAFYVLMAWTRLFQKVEFEDDGFVSMVIVFAIVLGLLIAACVFAHRKASSNRAIRRIFKETRKALTR